MWFGYFLIRAYQRKANLSKKIHLQLIEEIYGNDIASYPAYLAMLNLAIRHPTTPSYPRITKKDFFSMLENQRELFDQKKGTEVKKVKQMLPKFDAIIGNPPYTRQEDIGSMQGTKTKKEIQNVVKNYWGFEASARTSIYGYFFYHSATFLKDGGILAFLVSDSWLDAEFGTELQAFLCNNFEIIAVVTSQKERFFPAASVNTSIVIARKQKNEKKRHANEVRFVYLYQKIGEILKEYKNADKFVEYLLASPTAVMPSFKVNVVPQKIVLQDHKWGKFLKGHDIYFELLRRGGKNFVELQTVADVRFGIKTGCNDYFYGTDVTAQASAEIAVGKNPPIRNIVRVYRDEALNEIMDRYNLAVFETKYGDWWFVEKSLLQPVILSAKDVQGYVVKEGEIKDVGLFVNQIEKYLKTQPIKPHRYYDIAQYRMEMNWHHLHAWRYILYGEETPFKDKGSNKMTVVSQKPTCASRPAWWDLNTKDICDIAYTARLGEIHRIVVNGKYQVNKNLYEIFCRKVSKEFLGLFLNSLIARLFIENTGREMTGDLTIKELDVYQLAELPIFFDDATIQHFQPDIDALFQKMTTETPQSIFEELGTRDSSQIDLTKVKPFRYELDSKILEMMGYDDVISRDEALKKVYASLIEIIGTRLNKSDSTQSKSEKIKRNNENLEETYLVDIEEKIQEASLVAKENQEFARQLKKIVQKITSQKALQERLLHRFWQNTFQTDFDLDEIQRKDQGKLF
ncbi:MAG: hypothetical protein EAZ95_12745 [Bacteroidetes bacterium]|nr:MAG: hypothetical protein EAZ95_12745 [Bacteroidota bacterium]